MKNSTPSAHGSLAEPLTRREMTILAHLAEQKTNGEIAESESLALTTVKWYLQQIYTKLGINTRRQALAKARELGLLAAPPVPAAPSLPTGTLTFLFSDIVGSTPLWEQHPTQMAAALQVHNAVLRQAIDANHGVVFKIVGDAFQAAFSTAPLALMAAIQAQGDLQSAAWNELGALRVRMGLHTGEAEADPGGDEYAVSHTKNRVARIMSAASGGQILLSAETGELINHQLPPGVSLKDLGEHHLKGMALPEHLYQVCAPGLPQVFPALASAITRPNNLPVQLTSFIGRRPELEQLNLLLKRETTRLLTLTGSGGTGKTRLALQAAAGLLDEFPEGVWLVELAPLADPSLVANTVISALGLVEQPGKTPSAFLADYLGPKNLLLILDNCEHLVEACADLASVLLHAAPRLTILASSREILGVTGEIPYRVPPLSMPDPRRLSPLEELEGFDAVRLFIERARVVSPGFILTVDNAAEVAQIARRLDGIPLALELAAARLRLLSVGQIAQRLGDAFRLLTGGSRTALPRHQTLTALIEWSYNLLSEAERALLRGLSVFAGEWTLEAAEEVSGAGQDVLDLLGLLADKSLILAVNPSSDHGEMRYRMLETVRQYAHARLVGAGEAEAVRGRHLDYYLRLAERLEPKFRGREQITTLDTCETELDNLRLALEWALQADAEAELRLASSLMWFWHIRYHWTEGIEWLELGLKAEAQSRAGQPLTNSTALIRAKALTAQGFHISSRDEPFAANAIMLLSEALQFYRTSGPEYRLGLAWTLIWIANCLKDQNDWRQASALAEEAHSLFRESGDLHGMGECLQVIGGCEQGPAQKMKIYLERLALEESIGDADGIATALGFVAGVLFDEADYAGAWSGYTDSREHYRQVSNLKMFVSQGMMAAICAYFNGDLELAIYGFEEALEGFRGLANDLGVVDCLHWLCFTAVSGGHFDQAEEFNEKAAQIAQKTGNPENLTNVLYHRSRLARLRGNFAEARRLAQEAIHTASELGYSIILMQIEMSYQAMLDGNWQRAGEFLAEALPKIHFRWHVLAGNLADGVALLAVHQSKYEGAARLFGTRHWRGFNHILSPIERAQREVDFAAIQAALGEESFAQFRAEGAALAVTQVLTLAEENI